MTHFLLRQLHRLLPALVAGALLGGTAGADDWSRFRGGNGGGLSENGALPTTWSEQEVRWKATLPARGHSSPVVQGGKVFLTCADQESGARQVLAYDAASGALLWNQSLAGKSFRQHADNSYASATPAADAERVYVVWAGPDGSQLAALGHDGKPVWSLDLGPFIAQHGAGASPIVAQGLVVLPFEQDGPGDSFVIAVEAATGKERWRLPRTSGKLACSTPCLYQPAGAPAQLVCTSSNHGCYALDLATGKELWSLPQAFTQRCVASPVVAGGLVFAQDGQGAKGSRLVALRPPEQAGAPPQLVWQLTTGIPYVPCVAVRDEFLYLLTDGGQAACLRAATGKEVWRQGLGVGTFYGSPIIAGDRLYAISRHGEVVAWAAGAEFKLLGVTKLAEGSFATPAVADGRMFLRGFATLIAVGAR